MRAVEDVAEPRQQRRVEAERGEIERQRAAVEDAQHHALAVDRGHGRDAEIDLLAAHREPDAAVLRQTALGDVELRHDLDARDDGVAQPRRRRLDLAQHAVDAVAHAQPRFGGFEMDVGGAHLDRAGDQAVDQPDDRRLAGEILQPIEIGVAVVVVAFARRFVDPLDGGAAVAIEPVAGRLDVGGKGRATQHRLVEGEGERARGPVVERIGHRDDERGLALGDRQDARLLQEGAADAPGGDRLGGKFRRASAPASR